MKSKFRIESKIVAHQCLRIYNDHQPVKQFAFLAGWPKNTKTGAGKAGTVTNYTTQVFRFVPFGDSLIVENKSPRWLFAGSPYVASQPDYIETLQRLANFFLPVKVDQVDVIMNENENCRVY